MKVPFIDLGRFEEDFLERWSEVSSDVVRNTRFVGGPDVARLEERLAAETGAGHVVGCANGTDALQMALRAVGVSDGDVVLIPDATFWATFEAVVNVGGRPVTVDIDPADAQMDFELFLEALEAHEVRAVVLVHLYGWGSAHLEDFRATCRRCGVPLIEDCAQAFGTLRHGAQVLGGAEIATVSFYPAKVLGGCGDAGAVFCADGELAERVRLLGNHGRTSHYEHGLVGWNSRMGGLEAAYLDLSLRYLPVRLAERRAVTERYRDELGGLGMTFLAPPEGYLENAYLSVALMAPARRAALEQGLRDAGIGFGNVYPRSVSEQSGATGHLAGHVGGANAATLGRSVLNLPVFPYMEAEEVDYVIGTVRRVLDETDDLGPRGPFDWNASWL